MSQSRWEAVIGLEVHAQLDTRRKMFTPAAAGVAEPANTAVSEVCAGHPGTLPVVNDHAIELAIRAGLALGCQIQERSVFARKHYFYADLPKGYQISQADLPLCKGGAVEFELDGETKKFALERIHIEEDTGRSTHEGDWSRIDLNRAGTPLIEIVSEPDLRTPEEASDWFKELRQVLVTIGVCRGVLADGNMRCDANISIRPKGQEEFGTKVEVKNLNSFRFVKDALEYEIARQIEAAEAGEEIYSETRLWDDVERQTRLLRRKGESADYRYLPEPDLPALVVSQDRIDAIAAAMPELPAEARARLQSQYKLSAYDAGVLTTMSGFVAFLDRGIKAHNNPKGIVNWLIGSVAAGVNAGELSMSADGGALHAQGEVMVSPEQVASLQAMIDSGRLSNTLARQVFALLLESGRDPEKIVKDEGLEQVSDESAIEEIIREVMAKNPSEVEAYRGGKVALVGFFVGQVMRATKGKGDPKVVNQLVRRMLES